MQHNSHLDASLQCVVDARDLFLDERTLYGVQRLHHFVIHRNCKRFVVLQCTMIESEICVRAEDEIDRHEHEMASSHIAFLYVPIMSS
jgi:hypothetical protein